MAGAGRHLLAAGVFGDIEPGPDSKIVPKENAKRFGAQLDETAGTNPSPPTTLLDLDRLHSTPAGPEAARAGTQNRDHVRRRRRISALKLSEKRNTGGILTMILGGSHARAL